MNSKVRKRLRLGIAANLYGQLVTVAAQLAGVPILLLAWGVEQYGEWLLVFAVPAFLSVSDLGLSQSASNDMTARVARGDRDGALELFQSLLLFVLMISVVLLVVITIVLPFLDISELLNLKAIGNSDAQLLIWLLAANVLFRLPNAVTHAGYRCNGENALHVGVDATTRLAQQSSIWIIALLGGGPVEASAGQLAVTIVSTPVAAMAMFARHRWLKVWPQLHLDQLIRLARPALANSAIPIGYAINLQGVSVMVGVMAGPAALVAFTTTRTLTRLVTQLVYAVGDAAEPELAAANGTGDVALVRRLFMKVNASTFWLALIGSFGLILLGGWMITIWTRGAVAEDFLLMVLLTAAAFATVASHGSLVLLKSANQHQRGAIVIFIAAMICVGLASALLWALPAPSSAALAVLLCDVVVAGFVVILGCNFVSSKPAVLLRSNVQAPFAIFLRSRL